MSAVAHEHPDTVPSILTGHEHQRFARGSTPRLEDPNKTPQYILNGGPGTRRDSTLIAHYKSPDWTLRIKRKMDGKWIEVSWDELARLVPGKNPTKLQVKKLSKKFVEKDFKAIAEKDMYPILCSAFNAVCSVAKSGSWFRDVADQPESSWIDMRPDLVMYPKQAKIRQLYTLSNAEKKGVASAGKPGPTDTDRAQHIAKCMWGHIQAFVECKSKNKEGDAAFYFSDKSKFLRPSDAGEQSQAQIAKYATEIQIRQHRTHLWSFYFAGPYLRLQRWDRSGCMVSEAVNFQDDPTELVNFLYRFARMTPEQLGYDPTAVLALPKEIKMLINYKSDNFWLRNYQHYTLEEQEDFPIYKVAIPTYTDDPHPDDSSDGAKGKRTTRSGHSKDSLRPTKLKSYLLGAPVDYHNSPVARATKGYVALDMETQVLVFIKDQWRPIALGAHPELETYDRLRKHRVACVATCLGGGDVYFKDGKAQRTLAHELLPRNIGIDNSERWHTRLIIEEIGRPLSQYPNSPELMTILYHALMGHSEAWEEAGILHRDISAGNIMIDVASPAESLQGFLNDWDMCKYKEDLDNNVPAQPGRSGTWATLSALSLTYPKKPHEVADDLESIVYVLVQMALRFQRHKWTPLVSPEELTDNQLRVTNETNERLGSFVSSFFDAQNECENGYWSGGDVKRLVLEGNSLPVKLDPNDDGEPTALSQLIGDLYDLLRRHYAAIKYDDLERFLVPLKVNPKAAIRADEDAESETNSRKKKEARTNPAKTKDPLTRVRTRRAKARDQNLVPVPPPEQAHPGPSKTLPVRPQDDHITTNPIGVAQRVLDTHEEMLAAFERILYVDESKTQPRDLSKYKDDKWYDQFDGLKTSYNASDKNPSGKSRSGDKRKANTEDNEAWIRRQKRLWPGVRGETWRGSDIPSGLATVEEKDES